MIRLALLLALFSTAAEAEFTLSESDGFVVLENGRDIKAAIAPEQGGELSGFEVKFDGAWHELIYRARDYTDQAGWRGKSMTLWPATGPSFLPEAGRHHYRVGDEIHPMPNHGFARDRNWKVATSEASADLASVTLVMQSDDGDRELYPFDFVLQIEYRLESDRLSLVYTVSAATANTRPMPFSIGNHITFRAPLVAGAAADQLLFRTALPDRLIRDENRVFAGEVQPNPLTGWQPLSALPRRDAVSLGGPAGPAELLLKDPSGLQVRLAHQASKEPALPAVRFNLWADTEEGFFSPEPWIGTQNALNTGAGLVLLEPGENWTWQIDIIPLRAEMPGEHPEEVSP